VALPIDVALHRDFAHVTAAAGRLHGGFCLGITHNF